MPKESPAYHEQETFAGYNYEDDPQWRKKPLTPATLQVHDVRLETLRLDRGPLLEIEERFASNIVPVNAAHTPSSAYVRVSDATTNPIQRQAFTAHEENFGWIRHLRLHNYQQNIYDGEDAAKCRWIHCSSKFPQYLSGMLWALSDDMEMIAGSMSLLEHAIQRNTRFSKHGKYFAPFSQSLRPKGKSSEQEIYPLLVAVPFLDWTVQGSTPPLRFQVDRREGFSSSRSSAHVIRSILQYYYRLEDTSDREGSQVFSKHKPWSTNRELDLKVRGWYGHYPSGLNVDELWMIVVDAQHIVTFSSNQSWKSRWPPFQLSSRISDIAFRGIRNHYFRSEEKREYTALTHAVACLSGAIGMMHRNFWPDLVLCLTDRYAGHLGHLQYRLHRSPNSKLVMDLLACQEELNIVIQISEQQIEMIQQLQLQVSQDDVSPKHDSEATSPASRRHSSYGYGEFDDFDTARRAMVPRRSTYGQLSASSLPDPLAQLVDNLERELADLRDLRDNTDRQVTRTIQLVNIRMEDHGKAILVFTVVTIIFLPLNFVSSFFGMNFSDIRNTATTQWLFWAVALCVTAGVVGISILLAFSGGAVLDRIYVWRETRRERNLSATTAQRRTTLHGQSGFVVHGTGHEGGWYDAP